MSQDAHPSELVLYDGECGLCLSSVQWLLQRDSEGRLRYAPLQGETASALRASGLPIPADYDSMVFVDGGRVSLRARAVGAVLRRVRWPWPWLAWLLFLPLLPNLGYRLVARLRHRLWPATPSCLLPTPEQAARFLP